MSDPNTPGLVVTAGEAMLALVGGSGRPVSLAETFTAHVAGAEVNVAIGLTRLGHRSRWIGRLGADQIGEAVSRRLRAEGVELRVMIDPDAATGLLLRNASPGGATVVQYARAHSAATRWSTSEIPTDSLSGATILHLSGITAMLSSTCTAAVHQLLHDAKAAGVTVSFDANVRTALGSAEQWRLTVGPLLSQADIVFAGQDELAILEADVSSLLAGGVSEVVVKHTDHSAATHTTTGVTVQQPHKVRTVDPVGAGDAFAAGYLSAVLEDRPTAQRLARAALVAASAVQLVGDTEGVPWRADVRRRESSEDVDGLVLR